MYWFGNLIISILHPGLVSGFLSDRYQPM
jgi:hypothetical protein